MITLYRLHTAALINSQLCDDDEVPPSLEGVLVLQDMRALAPHLVQDLHLFPDGRLLPAAQTNELGCKLQATLPVLATVDNAKSPPTIIEQQPLGGALCCSHAPVPEITQALGALICGHVHPRRFSFIKS